MIDDGYPDVTDGPVRYSPVISGEGVVLGYLWASPTEDAAGFVARAAAGTVHAMNAAWVWRSRLAEARQRGLPALSALREWVGEDPAAGHRVPTRSYAAAATPQWRLAGALPPYSERTTTSLAGLRRLAEDLRADP